MKALYSIITGIPYPLRAALLCVLFSASSQVLAFNNPPSFTPGDEPYSSACDGAVRFAGWMQNVTDNDGDHATLRFEVISVSNADMFIVPPWVSWPSLSLNYQLKPGTPGGLSSEVTAVLSDDGGTEGGGSDTSSPQSWKIHTVDCVDKETASLELSVDTDNDGIVDALDTDDDNDGISDTEEGSGLLDTDGDETPDSVDTDSDNDLIPDQDETFDADGDGIRDSEEPRGIDIQTDTDGDGVHDGIDLDDDNDGIIDSLEGAGRTDTDNDGIVDSRDLDSDNDGRSDLLESGLNLILLTFDASWSLEDEVGENGLVDKVETFADSGYPLNYPVDADADGIPDFQDVISRLLSDDEPIAASAGQTVSTGVEGVGCAVGRGGADPLLLIMSLLSFFALLRQRGFARRR
jgi:hypothetical protein